jgi:hypothetical protein
MPVMGVPTFERFFRDAASLDVDKDDVRRFNDFVDHKVYDMLLLGVATAKANRRDVIQWMDLPITKGIQERWHEFDDMEEAPDMTAILDQILARPPLDADLSDEVQQRLPSLAGGLGLAVARSFRIIDSKLENPSSEHWERALRLFDLLL